MSTLLKSLNILTDSNKNWANMVYAHICSLTKKAYDAKGTCSIMLTGGQSTAILYEYWRNNPMPESDCINYYFGDERAVHPNDAESNYGLAVNLLFGNNLNNIKIHRLKADSKDRKRAILEYSALLPDQVDIVLLGIGKDGHIASIFPGSNYVYRSGEKIMESFCPFWPNTRLSITADVILEARNILLLAKGKEKGKILAKAIQEPDNLKEMPIRLTIGRDWLLDYDAYEALMNEKKSES